MICVIIFGHQQQKLQESNICETSGNGDVVSAAKADTPHQIIGVSLKGIVQ